MAREELGLLRTIRDSQVFEAEEHFLAGVAAAALGSLGWVETNSAAGTNTRQTSIVNHPGILRIVTGAVSGNNKRLHFGETAAEPNFTPTTFDRFRWVVRVPTITTLTIRLGLMQDVSAANGGTAGAYFEFDPATSATWGMVTRQGGVQTRNAGTTVTAGNWYLLEARRLTGGAWEFWINNVLQFTNAANLPTTDCAFGVLCQTGTAAARNVDLDYCYVRATLGPLFT